MSVAKAIELAAAHLGSKKALCEALGCNRQAVHAWTKKGVPLKRALQIERLTDGQVLKEWLKPGFFDDFIQPKK